MEPVLLIDDDIELCSMLQDYLMRHGFEITTEHNGELGLHRALTGNYSIVLLDVMLPGLDGFEVLRRLRSSSQVSVLLLTARGEDIDRIVGLEIGADDYLPKPFNPRELLARIRAILRRSAANRQSDEKRSVIKHLSVAGIELDAGARTVVCNQVELDLTNVEFALLGALMESPGQILTREHLTEIVLDRRFNPFDRSLDMHVSRLRRKLDDAANLGDQIKTIRSVGYQLAVPVAHPPHSTGSQHRTGREI
ncbi:response regulator transcription factor [Acidicapsa ligni]|uniref:response regulator transcription factor n=1 Tax=Acidicapsa ligni TaxID=542300 RepID=UPI0021E0103D|nr:response regulator transcription factor [Acidicapsa ligni]